MAPQISLEFEIPKFRGNAGNLLQHWVLCDILAACRNRARQIGFIDAHSMAPLARERPKRDGTAYLFDLVHERLPGEQTPYEKAWQRLAPCSSEYPNSAAFLRVVWPGIYSLLLCESDPSTVQELQQWAHEAKRSPKCVDAEVADGDWRGRFRDGLPVSYDLTFLSFDPYMFDRNGPGQNPNGNMYPRDLDLLADAVEPIHGGVLVQLSTYSANNDNPQPAVIEMVTSRLERSGLQQIAVVPADGNMMSLIFGRNVEVTPRMRSLPTRFNAWLNRVRDERPGGQSGAVSIYSID